MTDRSWAELDCTVGLNWGQTSVPTATFKEGKVGKSKQVLEIVRRERGESTFTSQGSNPIRT